jgi:hypothetical protein
MTSRRHAQFAMTMASILCLSSCADRPDAAALKSATTQSKIGSKLKKFSVAKLPKLHMPKSLFGPDVKIVEPRVKDLKELPSGSELAEAYRKRQRGFFWIVGGPVDFKEPDLPSPGIDTSEGLLPPLPQ